MSPAVVTRTLAGWCLLTALGITAYWIMWWRSNHEEPWLPDGYVEHERAFVFTDAPLTVLLIVAAILMLRHSPWAPAVALFAAGMLSFLGIIDAAYFAHTGMFLPERDGYANVFIVTAVLGLAACLVLWAVAELRRDRAPQAQPAGSSVAS